MKRGKTKYITGEDDPESAMKVPLKIFMVSMIGLTLPVRTAKYSRYD